jgi:hypothetical protein
MAMSAGKFEIKTCPIIGPYNQQRFKQFGPEDTANFYLVNDKNTKKPFAMYPTMGRSHINYLGTNQLVFGSQPRGIFKSISYAYIIEAGTVFRIDAQYNQVAIGTLSSTSGSVYFTFLVVGSIVFACFVDDQFIYIYRENSAAGLQKVTDPNAPGVFTVDGAVAKPGFIAAFGNRITVSVRGSSQFVLSKINLGGSSFDPATCFTNATTPQVYALASGKIQQMGVLNNTLYIFSDFVTDVISNIPSQFPATLTGVVISFPWKFNSTYNWNFGMANSNSLDIDFGYIAFLAQNSDGLLQFMMSKGGQPEKISTNAIDALMQNYTNLYGANNPFLSRNSNGFLYQYENTIFYRMSGGNFTNNGILDQEQNANCIEFCVDAQEWHRSIEVNGERNRIQSHIYFNFKHLVTVTDDGTVYDMSGQYYFNEIRNTAQDDPQASDAYIAYPFRYERVTPLIYEEDYAEFETEFVQIDFVWGESNINFSSAPFNNAVFIIDEVAGMDGNPQYMITDQVGPDGQPIYILAEQGNTPQLNEQFYNYLYKPSIELYFSDDGGISFLPADMREFSQMGVYSWRMRWYQLGPSRNRVYKLIAVSPVPIVILGATMNVRRISGGAA